MFFGFGVLASLFASSSDDSMLLNVQCSGVPASVSLDQIVSDVLQDVQVVGGVHSLEDSISSVTLECLGCDDLKYHQVVYWQGMLAFDVFDRTGILPTCYINLYEDEPSAKRLGAPLDDMPVELSVDCKGIKESELSMKALGYSTYALQEAYNQVHLKTDGGDAHLSGLHFDHVEHHTAGALGGVSTELKNVNSKKKKPPSKTDKPSTYLYIGGWGCRLCPPDDDAMLGLGDSGAALSAWENAFTAALQESPFPEFKEVQKCDINMHPVKSSSPIVEAPHVGHHLAADAHLASLTSVVGDTDPIEGMPVEVGFDCKDVEESELSLKALAYAGHSLEEVYNQVHLKMDGGDAEISGLHFDHVEHHTAGALGGASTGLKNVNSKKKKPPSRTDQPSTFLYIGGWGCRLCPPDDDAMLGLGDSGIALSAWENAFTAALQESPFLEFKKAKDCKILMKPFHGTASVAATA